MRKLPEHPEHLARAIAARLENADVRPLCKRCYANSWIVTEQVMEQYSMVVYCAECDTAYLMSVDEIPLLNVVE
jgi:hypothetical protein